MDYLHRTYLQILGLPISGLSFLRKTHGKTADPDIYQPMKMLAPPWRAP